MCIRLLYRIISFIGTVTFSCATHAQTPYDSFAPETSRPMLGVEALAEMEKARQKEAETMMFDTLFYLAVIDVQQERVLLVAMECGEVIAMAPLTDDWRKWLSVDPLADNYPWISPYAYCAWNPIGNIDPDGMDIYNINEETGSIEIIKTEGDIHYYYLKKGTTTSYVGSFQQNENGLIQLAGNISFSNSSGTDCRISVKEGESSKSFIHPNALASLIGAVGSLGYSDVTIIQFSMSDGSSPPPSISHRGGLNGDLRYLRQDGKSLATNVGGDNFDALRNEALTAALDKFGWHDMISERVGGYLLPHTSAARERGIKSNHANHLHLQGYYPHLLETYMIMLSPIVVYGK